MKTIIWFTAIFALVAFIFSATVHAAESLALNLWLDESQPTIQELMLK